MTHPHGQDAEVMTVGPDEIVVTFTSDPGVEAQVTVDGISVETTGPHHVARITGLEPATAYEVEIDGVALAEADERYFPDTIETLEQPSGDLLCTVATVNDVHFGEVECGKLEGWGGDFSGPIFTSDDLSADGTYPEVTNAGAIREIEDLDPDAVLAKGDLTSFGTEEEYEAFLAAYSRLGARMHHIRGNHDAAHTDAIAAHGPFSVELPGATLAVLDTVIPRHHSGQITRDQLAWLDELAADADRPVLVFGHHNIWNLYADHRSPDYFGINPDDSEALVEVAARREAVAGYFAGHTHRNRVRRFEEARDVPFVEVACVKDYPGAWAEYRIHEGGFVQMHRRITTPDALEWTEKTRGMFQGLYRDYALGPLDWRCFSERF